MNPIHPARLHPSPPPAPVRGRYVLYWMQQAQRAENNHALEYALACASPLRLPVLAGFALTAFPEANLRHYAFMIEGLLETRDRLAARGIGLCIRNGPPEEVIPQLARHAALLVTDAGALPLQRAWRERVAARVSCPLVEVESDVLVPLAEVSDHPEFAARTLRPKLRRRLSDFLLPLPNTPVTVPSLHLVRRSLPLDDPADLCRTLVVSDRVSPVSAGFPGGLAAARRRLDAFIRHALSAYPDHAADPALDATSRLSPYLHFGQISPLEIALRVSASGAPPAAVDAFLEQLLVRRELAFNSARFRTACDRYESLPPWALKTLAAHRRDPREFVYDRDSWEAAATHDPCWNAAQTQLLRTGHMHNTMRMYWGKKILEWSRSPKEAFETALYLNNTYELDGRDPNGIAGVAWCFGLHDRPWSPRPVFGTVRYMNANGLRRKYHIQTYRDRWHP